MNRLEIVKLNTKGCWTQVQVNNVPCLEYTNKIKTTWNMGEGSLFTHLLTPIYLHFDNQKLS